MTAFGRLEPPDWDHLARHPMAEALPEASTRTWRDWVVPVQYDQGNYPYCAAVSTCSALTAAAWAKGREVEAYDGLPIYNWANANDGIPQPHDGTTVRAAFEYVRTVGAPEVGDPTDPSGLDKLARYVWTQNVDDVVQALLTTGTVNIGVNWYSSMMNIDSSNYLRITPTATILGGHAVCLRGVNTVAGTVTVRNQWKDWGYAGLNGAWLAITDLARLLGENGEAVLALW